MKTIHINKKIIAVLNIVSFTILLTLCSCSTFLSGRARAVDVGFTISNNNTVLELTVPSTVNLELNPTSGSAFGTTDLIIVTGTNHPYGYTLTMAVPDTNLTNSDLTITDNPNNILLDGSNHPTIPTLATGSYTEDAFTTNAWGYKLSTAANYSSMPSSLELLKTGAESNATTTTISLATKVDTTIPAGTYTTIINFMAVTNPKPYIQDFTLANCESLASSANYTVYDRRDDNDYTVRYINGYCWMTQNLRITGTISSTDSNFTGEDFNVSEYSLSSSDSSYSGHCDQTNGYNYACSKVSSYKTVGAWYNYYAVTVGTISTSYNVAAVTSDICPSGWHLPSSMDFATLIGNTDAGYQPINTSINNFTVTTGGVYVEGVNSNIEYGRWWSTTAHDHERRRRAAYDNINNLFDSGVRMGNVRTTGEFVRCVRTS